VSSRAHLDASAILGRTRRAGRRVFRQSPRFCDVFVVRIRGAIVDGDRTVTFGHEALHCFGFSHD